MNIYIIFPLSIIFLGFVFCQDEVQPEEFPINLNTRAIFEFGQPLDTIMTSPVEREYGEPEKRMVGYGNLGKRMTGYGALGMKKRMGGYSGFEKRMTGFGNLGKRMQGYSMLKRMAGYHI